MQIKNNTPDDNRPVTILAYGFRPFFLLAGLQATLAMIVWLGAYTGMISLPDTLAPMLWHGHEMLFGFATATLCGFMLTAVPNWTQTPPVTGGRLGLLVALWFAGRLAFFMAGTLPMMVVAAADLLLVPALALMIGIPIFAKRQKRNYFFPILLLVLFFANILIHLQTTGLSDNTAETGLFLAIYVFAMMLCLISGRVIPNFTASALRLRGEDAPVRISMPLELATFAAIVLTAISDLAIGADTPSGIMAIVAAALLALRMKNWYTLKTMNEPMLWVLHLGAMWLVLAFALKGVAALSGFISTSTVFHVLTIGAIGTLTTAIMTRAPLGHTGRQFIVGKPIVVSYLLISFAAVVRVGGPALMPAAYDAFIIAAGLMWTLAFAIYVCVYWPILTGPRVDGRPG